MNRLGLRARITALFALGAFGISALLAFSTYQLTRQRLLDERERTALRATYYDAAAVQAGLSTPQASLVDVLRSLDTGSSRRPVIRRAGQWYARTADSNITESIPASLQQLAEEGRPGLQRVRIKRTPALVVAVPLTPAAATYYEVIDLGELQRTLRSLAIVLSGVALATAAAGAGLGWWAGRRVLLPLTSVADTATSIAGGNLDARIDPAREPDVARLATSFNAMVDALAARMDRDRRFAADVSHELRSPLQTLSAATSVLANSRDPMSERTTAAVRLLVAEVDRFTRLVTDLLQLSRGDRPAERRDVDVTALVADLCAARGVPLEGDPVVASVDPRRVQQIVVNLLDNAERYGGGATAARVLREGPFVVIEVDDEGPGVPAGEKELVFDRFARGRAASTRGDSDGTGLGLALVAQHAAAHQGQAVALDRPGGGARFRVELRG